MSPSNRRPLSPAPSDAGVAFFQQSARKKQLIMRSHGSRTGLISATLPDYNVLKSILRKIRDPCEQAQESLDLSLQLLSCQIIKRRPVT